MPSSTSQNSNEPARLLRTLAAAFSGVLFGVFLSKLHTSDKDAAKSVSPQGYTEKESSGRQPERVIVSEIAPPPIDSNKAERSESNTPRWEKIAQWSIAVATVGLLIVNIFEMYTLRQQLTGTMSAFVDPKIDFNGFRQPDEYLSVSLGNRGHLIARDIGARLKVTLRSIPDGKIIQTLPDFVFSESEMNALQETPAAVVHRYTLNISQAEWEKIRATQETIRVEGPFHYFNGFQKVSHQICASILYYEIRDNLGQFRNGSGPSMVNCDEFPVQLDSGLKWKQEHEGKEWK